MWRSSRYRADVLETRLDHRPHPAASGIHHVHLEGLPGVVVSSRALVLLPQVSTVLDRVKYDLTTL